MTSDNFNAVYITEDSLKHHLEITETEFILVMVKTQAEVIYIHTDRNGHGYTTVQYEDLKTNTFAGILGKLGQTITVERQVKKYKGVAND